MTERLHLKPHDLGEWFHNVHLPDGTQTAPRHWLGDFPRYKWETIAPELPEDLSGWSALDIGCNGGYYAIELAKRGADVLAIDIDERYLQQARWAVQAFGLSDRVSVRRMEVYEINRLPDSFDLILFMGVFYHLRYPLLALDLIASRAPKLLVLQTLTLRESTVFEPDHDYAFADRDVMLTPGWPKMAFVERCFANDPTNWWVPNEAAVRSMLRSAGLSVISVPEPETFICRPAGGMYDEFQRQGFREFEAVFRGSHPPS